MRSRTLLLLALLSSCAKLEGETPPQITTSGPHSVPVGETVTVAAATKGMRDRGYTFRSGNETLAQVDAGGVVHGVAAGETVITVTGDDSKLVAQHPMVVVPVEQSTDLPNFELWQSSPHADPTAEAFNHWNEDGAVPVECARCHSAEGFVDYLGGDGTAPGSVEVPAPVASVIDCNTCHNQAAEALTSVTFPSGTTVSELGPEARCMTCHQGRASMDTVNESITAAGVTSDDEVSASLGFENIHYYPAAATLFAGVARGGYQYDDRVYDTRFRHVAGLDTCVGCHNPHSTQPRFNECVNCHPGATDVSGAHDIRMIASKNQDYDGDGSTSEGIYYELIGMRDRLLEAMQRYGAERAAPLCHAEPYPYFFNDDGDGICSAEEAVFGNSYSTWTARLVRAAYNFQMATVDPGAFAHNAKYIIELLYDSTADLEQALVVPIGMDALVRTDVGHFNGASEAARHWDVDDEVSASCSRCHGGATGFRFFLTYGVGQAVLETANGLECSTCHESFGSTFDVLEVAKTTFPGNVTRDLEGNSDLCGTCHAGRESKSTIDAQIATGTYKFMNVHYLPAAAVHAGSTAHVGYEYAAHTYAGTPSHTGGVACTSCHDPVASNHTFLVTDTWDSRCETCHADGSEPDDIRETHTDDYDGDGNTTETLANEIAGLGNRVLVAMDGVAGSSGLCYSPTVYPYFFKDVDADGQPLCSSSDAVNANKFSAWTPALMKAAHNYQISQKEPGAWAHNFDYMAQLLHDSIEDLGGSLTGLVRP